MRIWPCIWRATALEIGVPGAMAWHSHRRAGSGRPAVLDSSHAGPGWRRAASSRQVAAASAAARPATAMGGDVAVVTTLLPAGRPASLTQAPPRAGRLHRTDHTDALDSSPARTVGARLATASSRG